MMIEDFDPKRLVSANRRIHHHQRADLARYWRPLGEKAATGVEPRDLAHLTFWFRFPTNHRRDIANLYPYVVKPLVDGMSEDAGFVPGDDDRHLIVDMRRDWPNGPHRIRITVADYPCQGCLRGAALLLPCHPERLCWTCAAYYCATCNEDERYATEEHFGRRGK